MAEQFAVSVANAQAYDPTTDNLLFTGTANITTGFNISMDNAQVRGGIDNPLQFSYYHSRQVEVNVESSKWEFGFLASAVGSQILTQAEDVFESECIEFDGSGNATLSKTPVGDVSVQLADGGIIRLTPAGAVISSPANANKQATAYFQYNTTVSSVTIGATNTPAIVKLVLTSKLQDKNGVVHDLQIEIPRYQLNGSFEISLEASSVSTSMLSGEALVLAGTCGEGDKYAIVRVIENDSTTVAINQLASSPATIEDVADTTHQLTVTGLRGGNYLPQTVAAGDLTFSMKAGSDADITVDANGLVTIAVGATTADTGTVVIALTSNPTVKDEVNVVVS